MNRHKNTTARVRTAPVILTSSPLFEVAADAAMPNLGAGRRKKQEFANKFVSFRSPERAAGRDLVSGPGDGFRFELAFRRPQETELSLSGQAVGLVISSQ